LLIVAGVWLGPYIYTLVVNHFSPVVVPRSHFVGQHGENKRLIVFVHGVMGDMDNTWLNPETQSSWPELIKEDQDLDKFDVFVYGYASPPIGNASTIKEISTRFLQQIKDFGFFKNYAEIDFITHSMGGIITKRALDMLNTPSDSPLLQKVHTHLYRAGRAPHPSRVIWWAAGLAELRGPLSALHATPLLAIYVARSLPAHYPYISLACRVEGGLEFGRFYSLLASEKCWLDNWGGLYLGKFLAGLYTGYTPSPARWSNTRGRF
jgi:hypothetical protein